MIKPSGLWCDLCRKPILDDPYWNISFKDLGFETKRGHACDSCKKEHDKKKLEEKGEES